MYGSGRQVMTKPMEWGRLAAPLLKTSRRSISLLLGSDNNATKKKNKNKKKKKKKKKKEWMYSLQSNLTDTNHLGNLRWYKNWKLTV